MELPALETLDVVVDAHVAQVRFKRPEALNTMTLAFWRELPIVMRELDARGDVRVVVLGSTGKHFTAGMDLSVFAGQGLAPPTTQEAGRQREALRRTVLELQESLTSLERVRMPVLAAIQGGCIGGGVDLICACDVRYCSADAFFCIQETNLGMAADCGTLQRLPKLIPAGSARELAYTGRRMPAARAKEVGLVNEVFESHEALLAGVTQVAREIAERSPLAVHGTKMMLDHARDHSVADGLAYMAAWQSGMFHATDLFEAMSARQQKRTPQFEDLQALKEPE